jgi:glycosyltransferase involved in cell wall biosynthesis
MLKTIRNHRTHNTVQKTKQPYQKSNKKLEEKRANTICFEHTRTQRKVNALIVCNTIPYPPLVGGNVRMCSLMKRLNISGVDITLLCRTDEKQVHNANGLQAYCKKIHLVPVRMDRTVLQKVRLLLSAKGWRKIASWIKRLAQGTPLAMVKEYDPLFSDALQEVIQSETFDIIQFEFMETGLYALDVMRGWNKRGRQHTRKAKLLLVEIDITGVMIARMKQYAPLTQKVKWTIQYTGLEAYERRMFRIFDHIIAMSENDKNKIMQIQPKANQITVIKSGVDLEKHRVSTEKNIKPHVVFLGSMKFIPNQDGLKWFLDSILPLVQMDIDDVVVDVIGETDPTMVEQYVNKNIHFHGIVKELETVIRSNSVFICPIRIGAGTKLKMVTAMALGIPTVSTSVGAEGIEVEEHDGVLIADEKHVFSDKLKQLLQDPSRRQVLGEKARSFVKHNYSWDNIARTQKELYNQLVVGKQSSFSARERGVIVFGENVGYQCGGAEKSTFEMLKRMQVEPSNVVYYEDTMLDTKCAKLPYQNTQAIRLKKMPKWPYVQYFMNYMNRSKLEHTLDSSRVLLAQGVTAGIAINTFQGDSVYMVVDESSLNIYRCYEAGVCQKVKFWIRYILQLPFYLFFCQQNRKAMEKAKMIVACSRFMAKGVSERYQRTVHIIYPSIEYDTYTTESVPPIEKRKYIVLIGDYSCKGIHMFERIAKQFPEYAFMVVGKTAKTSPCRNIRYHDYVDNTIEIYRKAKMLLMPSKWEEAFGMVAVEASLLGIPVLVSDRGGLPETVPESYVVKQHECLQAWVDKINKMLDRPGKHIKEAKRHARQFEDATQYTILKKLCKEDTKQETGDAL